LPFGIAFSWSLDENHVEMSQIRRSFRLLQRDFEQLKISVQGFYQAKPLIPTHLSMPHDHGYGGRFRGDKFANGIAQLKLQIFYALIQNLIRAHSPLSFEH